MQHQKPSPPNGTTKRKAEPRSEVVTGKVSLRVKRFLQREIHGSSISMAQHVSNILSEYVASKTS